LSPCLDLSLMPTFYKRYSSLHQGEKQLDTDYNRSID